MRFRLLDKEGKSIVHEGVMPRATSPLVVSWGQRAFAKSGERTDQGEVTADFQEVDAFRIGGAFGG